MRRSFAEYQSLSESLCFSSSNRFLRWLEQQPFCRECKPVEKKHKTKYKDREKQRKARIDSALGLHFKKMPLDDLCIFIAECWCVLQSDWSL